MYDLLTGTSAPVMSGFTDLDEVLGGFQRSDLVILAARSSVGKLDFTQLGEVKKTWA